MSKLLAFLLLIILMPVLVILGLMIYILDGSPILFRQQRLGYRRQPFCIYKFRTMSHGSVTKCGAFLRSTGLDELPQLWNILRGEMTFIGPRPLTPEDITRLGWDHRDHWDRFQKIPGITGLGQISTVCDPVVTRSLEKRAVHASFWENLRIILTTIMQGIVGKEHHKKPYESTR